MSEVKLLIELKVTKTKNRRLEKLVKDISDVLGQSTFNRNLIVIDSLIREMEIENERKTKAADNENMHENSLEVKR